MLALAFLPVTPAYAASTFTSKQTGNWTDGSTWDLGSVPNPANGDSVVIATGHTVTLTAATTVGGSLTINSGGTLSTSASNFDLTLAGDFTNNGGTFNAGSSNIAFTAISNQSIAGFTTTGTVSMIKTGGAATFAGNVIGGGLTINGSGGTLNLGSGLTHTFTGIWTRTAGTLDGGSSTLNLSGALSGSTATFTAGTGTVNYNALGAQTVAAVTYNNLTLSGSGVKTITATSTVNGVLSMEGDATAAGTTALVYGSAATLQYNTATDRTAGATEWKTPFTASGGVIIANTGVITMNVAKVFNAGVPLTINSGAALATNNLALTLGGNFINNGGTFTAGSSAITITNTAATQSIAGFTTTGTVSMTKTAGTATFTGDVSGGGLTINGSGGTLNLGSGLTHTFTGTWTRSVGTGILDGGSSTLNLKGGLSGTGGTFTAGTGTVNYGGTTATQAVAGVIYNNLILSGGSSGGGAKTLPASLTTVNGDLTLSTVNPGTTTTTATLGAALTIGGNLTIGASTTLDVSASNYALNVAGNWTNNGTFNPRTTTATVTLQGASTQTISGATATTFNRLTINNTSGGVTLSTNATVNNVLTLTSGKITTGASSLIIETTGSAAGASGSSYIFGNLQKNFATGAQSFTFDIGDATNYTPVAVAFANVSTAGNVTATTTVGEHPNIASIVGLNSSKDVNRYWTLTPDINLVFTTYSATFTFVDGDKDAGVNTSNFIVKRYSSGWFSTTTGSQLANSTQATGMTGMGDFVVGELDTTAPSVSMSSAAANPTNVSPIVVTVTFDENVTGFTSGDIVAGNGTVSNFAGSGLSYSFNLTPSSNGLVTADIAASVAQDSAGNNNTAATQFSRTYDTTAPTVSMSSTATDPTNVSPIVVTVTFNESVVNFTSGDITAGNSVVSNFAGSGASYSFNLAPSSNGLVTANIAASVAQDSAGNNNTAATQFSRTYDTTAPTVSMSSTATDPTNVSPIVVTVTFNESVVNFTSGDVTAGNGVVSNFAGSGASYSFNLAPSSNGLVTANIAASVAQDSAGNNNTAATQFSRTYDTTAPTVSSIVRADPDPTNSATVNFTVTFSESVASVDTADFSLTTTGGISGASIMGVSGSGLTRTVTVNTGSGNGTIRLDIPGTAVIADLAGNQLTAGLPYTSGQFYTVTRIFQIFLPLILK